jgi:hypothetical protein
MKLRRKIAIEIKRVEEHEITKYAGYYTGYLAALKWVLKQDSQAKKRRLGDGEWEDH